MSGPKRNPDKLNTIGVVVVGICGAVLVYVTIVALQAFYMDDTSEIQTMADYGGQDTVARNTKTTQLGSITGQAQPNPAPQGGGSQTYRISIDHAMKRVLEEVKADPKNVGNLVPAIGRSDKPTVLPIPGRPRQIPSAGSGEGSGSGAASTTGGAEGSAAQPNAGSGSAAANPGVGSAAQQVPTGGQGPGGGAPVGAEGDKTKNAGGGSGTSQKVTPAAGSTNDPKATKTQTPKAPATNTGSAATKGNAR
ncbi:MAG TPA: hypothetical protein VFQ53_20620 [Kofleriaceae bacterium]|nr:hypothetical protein [Kofleriaceae bacterium]